MCYLLTWGFCLSVTGDKARDSINGATFFSSTMSFCEHNFIKRGLACDFGGKVSFETGLLVWPRRALNFGSSHLQLLLLYNYCLLIIKYQIIV